MYLLAFLLKAVSPHLNSKFWTAVLASGYLAMWAETWILNCTCSFQDVYVNRNMSMWTENEFCKKWILHTLSHLCGQLQLWHILSQLTHQSVSFRVCFMLVPTFLFCILEMQKELKAEFWTKMSEISFQVMRRNGFANVLVIYISVHVDILKAKTAVQTLEFRWGETVESRMAGRYIHTGAYMCALHDKWAGHVVWSIFLTLYLGTWYSSWTRDLHTADTMHHNPHTHPPQIHSLPGHTHHDKWTCNAHGHVWEKCGTYVAMTCIWQLWDI